jgi:hypothetical protein
MSLRRIASASEHLTMVSGQLGLATPHRRCMHELLFNDPAFSAHCLYDVRQIGQLKRIYRPAYTFFRIVSASTPLETRPPSMQMKIGRWEGLYPRIQSAAKHIRCGFVCGYRKIAGLFRSERSAIIGAAQPGVHGPDPSEDRATKKEREQ